MFKLNTLFKKNKENNFVKFLKFAIVGTISMIIHYSIYFLLLNTFNPNLSFSIGYLISFICNYYLNTFFTFKVRFTFLKFINFGISHLFNYFIQISLLNFFIFFDVSNELSPIPVYLISVPINFLLVKLAMKK